MKRGHSVTNWCRKGDLLTGVWRISANRSMCPNPVPLVVLVPPRYWKQKLQNFSNVTYETLPSMWFLKADVFVQSWSKTCIFLYTYHKGELHLVSTILLKQKYLLEEWWLNNLSAGIDTSSLNCCIFFFIQYIFLLLRRAHYPKYTVTELLLVKANKKLAVNFS